MKLPTLPFTTTDWSKIEPTRHPGETGYALRIPAVEKGFTARVAAGKAITESFTITVQPYAQRIRTRVLWRSILALCVCCSHIPVPP